ncbi:ABC transporter ATP-binding protein [candidate division KSB1 bacterium]|nr:ABC transporter ATP-binding protein [candidate division KSB1 bacterium]NIR70678.1 ABC transporter ATP-binding protein [candidate division KSB1 bacterium]NIS26030.1 ABC transporter ATP-binding protein [candidate division KSB1 bacterium]NIT72854.1 ABC transporter ATP-binding protein [candidate division KSB1 bacterium]NIU26695.1 ABC transporter ATP-binding protein [candidate division KSB1 bacterium]
MELNIQNLSKTYPNGIRALRNVTLNIPTGMFGLLGPNGAGKSTLMRIVSTLQESDSGSVSLDGINLLKQKDEVRKVLGYLPQEFGFYPKVRAQTLLEHFAALKGVVNSNERQELVDALLQRVNLWEARNQKLGEFSGGMKQRFGIAQALLGNPKLIIVDEPTAGLDPAERNRFLNLLSEIGENIVVILSTHIVDDVSGLCTNMAIINKGEILLTGDPSAVVEQMRGCIWEKRIEKSELPKYEEQFRVISTRLVAGKTIIRVFSESRPDSTFYSADVKLEDIYFKNLQTVA